MRRHGGTRVVSVLVAGALALGVPGVRLAHGQGAAGGAPGAAASAPSPNQQRAKELFTEGMAAAAAKDWKTAREKLNDAFTLHPHWQIAANLGRVEVELGWSQEAAGHLEYFLKNVDPSQVPQADIDQAKTLQLDVARKLATVTVVVDVPEADVLVDGKVVGKSPLPGRLFLHPGTKLLEARREGYETAKERLSLNAGSTQQVVFEMKAAKAGAGSAVKGPGGGGGRVAASGDDAYTGPVVYPDPTVRPSPWRSWVIGAGVGVAAVGLGVGIGFMVAASSQDSDGADVVEFLKYRTGSDKTICDQGLKDLQLWRANECSKLSESISRRDTFQTIAIIGFAAGGAAAATALTIALIPAGTTKKASFRVIPEVSPNSSGVSLVGAF